jgi:hypothetical protein
MEQQRERRWWIPLIASAVGGLFGAIAGAAFADDVGPTVDRLLAVVSSPTGALGASPQAPGAGSQGISSATDPSPASPPGKESVVHGPSITRGDFDGDGRVDHTVLTQAPDEVTIEVHQTGSPVQTLRFGVNPRVTGAICELPATLTADPLNCEPGEPLPGCRADNGAVQPTLGGGECVPNYQYWDHEQSRMGRWQPWSGGWACDFGGSRCLDSHRSRCTAEWYAAATR